MPDDIRPTDTKDLTPKEAAELAEQEDDVPPESPKNDVVEEEPHA